MPISELTKYKLLEMFNRHEDGAISVEKLVATAYALGHSDGHSQAMNEVKEVLDKPLTSPLPRRGYR